MREKSVDWKMGRIESPIDVHIQEVERAEEHDDCVKRTFKGYKNNKTLSSDRTRHVSDVDMMIHTEIKFRGKRQEKKLH